MARRGLGRGASRGLLAAVAVAVAALLVAGLGVVRLSEERTTTAPPASTAPPAPPAPTGPPARPPVSGPLLPALHDAPAPTPAGLSRAVRLVLGDRALGGTLAASVVDVASGDALLEQRATAAVVPASTLKIATAVAALTALEPTLRLPTRVVAGAAPGDVVLVGGGDSTLAGPGARSVYPRPARLADLAAQVRARGTRVRRVLVDDTAYSGPRLGPGWTQSYVTGGDVAPVGALMVDAGRVRPDEQTRAADPGLAAGEALARLLHADAPVVRAKAPAGAVRLAEVLSPPVPQLVEAMLVRSDNDLAESLARQVARIQGEPPTFTGAAAAVTSVLDGVLEQVGLPAASVRVSDGSGLSRLDRVQPGTVSRLLVAVAGGEQPRLAPVLPGLPVAGFDGTLAKRYRSGPSERAAGVVRAKTGTLLGVDALAGLLRTADGRLLAFDLTADAVPIGSTRAAERALDRLAAALAACGCRAPA